MEQFVAYPMGCGFNCIYVQGLGRSYRLNVSLRFTPLSIFTLNIPAAEPQATNFYVACYCTYTSAPRAKTY